MKVKTAIKILSLFLSVYIIFRLMKNHEQIEQLKKGIQTGNNFFIIPCQTLKTDPRTQSELNLVKAVSSNYSVLSADAANELVVTSNSALTFNENGVFKVTVLSDAVPFMNGSVLFATKEVGTYFVTVSNGTMIILP